MGVWARKIRFSFTPPPVAHPFWLLLVINIINEDAWFERWACQPISHKKIVFGNFWGDGADSFKNMDTLAGRRVSSTPGKRLAEARRASHLASLGEVMTHPYSWCWPATQYVGGGDDFDDAKLTLAKGRAASRGGGGGGGRQEAAAAAEAAAKGLARKVRPNRGKKKKAEDIDSDEGGLQ